ncbi:MULTISPECIES: tyrosine-type recombinase/integrase [Stenotrophomonas]|uniref:Integrase arm-type DNA-binding domain-containing protein n=2 Tax=Gammaproteobacteria TaxID=1236 RepID=A0ABU5MF18_9GAMM|nr:MULTISPECIES: integrase arm-type DNA-binding domain-containing protein [Stenotrophomonas]KLO00381.1 integrase [Stenotrophomonas maltophilia]MBK1557804.1 integrase arm-type DNA-binding domain-containing protein [Stenotrophomonas maltophilia]MBN5041354.1 integrase arm-type DNA-binding domain-containing protein [Stenotrophomonas maltophilia]MBN5071408.1 integrase arm-type DNA-binding domain-containing protein [Stenotrophomonas maltophilia]MCU1151238.1 integrase arm-type DNA-binding domain-cont
MPRTVAPLTDTAIRKAKPGPKPTKLRDGGGLYVQLNPDGSRWWRWDYRRPVTGKRNTLSLGTYPEVSLADARGRQAEARRLLASGIDPGEHRKAAKVAGVEKAANSFEVVTREWLGKQKWVESYRCKVVAWMDNDVFPWIGGRPVAELAAPDFLRVARRIEERGAIESAHRIMQNCGQVMRYAVATGRADRNPVADLRGALAPPMERHHAAITDPRELGGLLRAIDGYAGDASTRAALRLAPLVFVRPGELRHAEWSEIDLDAGEWNIPAHKMKMREPHLVPLSSQAVAILRDLQPLTGHRQYVFPGGRSPKRPLSDNALTAALRRMGFDKETMTAHGFRATARTLLDEVLGWRPDLIEHQLAHAVRDPNGRAYNRTSHLAERRKMMQAWADYLDALEADTGSTVVQFKPKAA